MVKVLSLKHFIQVLVLGLSLPATQAFAGKIPCVGCPTPCPDVIPCPATEYVAPLVCDPTIEIYEIYAHLDYWTALSRHFEPCEITFDDFRMTWTPVFEPGSQQQSLRPTTKLPKITMRAMQGDVAVTAQNIAGQRESKNRVAIVQGCFASPTVFLAEQISFDIEIMQSETTNQQK